jgi:hypothetical protein
MNRFFRIFTDALSVFFNNTDTDITSNNVQDAIKELDNSLKNKLDDTDLSKTLIKSDISQPTQEKVGQTVLVTANGDILNGQPVIWNYSNTIARAVTPLTLPSQHESIGISIQDITDGNKGEILVDGFCTARRTTSQLESNETILLNNNTTGNIRNLTNNTTFKDSGGDNDYSSNETYLITFDAGSGFTTKITVNNFNFEHAEVSGIMYDRLGIQVSDDDLNYTNIVVPWMYESAVSTPPYSQDRLSETDGYIFPRVSTGLEGEVIDTGKRFIRFYFSSDGSVVDTGWDLTIQPNTPYTDLNKPVPLGTSLYLENNYPSNKVIETSESNILFGFCANEDVSNDSVLMRVYLPKTTT